MALVRARHQAQQCNLSGSTKLVSLQRQSIGILVSSRSARAIAAREGAEAMVVCGKTPLPHEKHRQRAPLQPRAAVSTGRMGRKKIPWSRGASSTVTRAPLFLLTDGASCRRAAGYQLLHHGPQMLLRCCHAGRRAQVVADLGRKGQRAAAERVRRGAQPRRPYRCRQHCRHPGWLAGWLAVCRCTDGSRPLFVCSSVHLFICAEPRQPRSGSPL